MANEGLRHLVYVRSMEVSRIPVTEGGPIADVICETSCDARTYNFHGICAMEMQFSTSYPLILQGRRDIFSQQECRIGQCFSSGHYVVLLSCKETDVPLDRLKECVNNAVEIAKGMQEVSGVLGA